MDPAALAQFPVATITQDFRISGKALLARRRNSLKQDTTKKTAFRLKMRIACWTKSLPMPWTRASVRRSPKGALETGLCPLSNQSQPRLNGNWKMASSLNG
jgi:hypothetical protein